MKRVILIIILIVAPIFAENILNEFISSTSLTLKDVQNLKKEFSKTQFDSFYLKKLRLNMNYSEFDKNIEDEYEARIYPKSFAQINIEKKIYNLKKMELNSVYEESYLKLLREKYLLALEIYFKRNEYNLNQKISNLNQKKLEISFKSMENFSTIFDIAKVKREVMEIEFELKEKKFNYENLLLYIQKFIPKYSIDEIKKVFENFHFIDVAKLLSYVRDNKSNFLNSIDKSLKREKSDLELAKNEKELKELEDNFRINSIDVKYENDKDLNRAFSVGVSLEFPLSKSDNMEEKLNILKTKSRLDLKREELKNQVFNTILEIKKLGEKFLYYQNSIENDTFYDTYLKLPNPEPLIILDLQYNHLKIQKDMLTLEYKLYTQFINLLYITNNLNENILFKS